MKTLGLLFLITVFTNLPLLAKTRITIGTVNNSDMILMQHLSYEFLKTHPEIQLNWVVLEENVLRQRVTTDLATKGGQFDIITIGNYETSLWAQKGWLTHLDQFPNDYAIEDIIDNIRKNLSYDGKLYALPFYGESLMTFYRKDLFQKQGITMPKHPTYEEIYYFAKMLHQPKKNIYGICLRGKAGWGENVALLSSLVHAFGGRWFDKNWKPQLTSPEWKRAISYYVDILLQYGPPGSFHNGHNENRAMFANGRCAMLIDATVVAGFLANPQKSVVHEVVGFAKAPKTQVATGSQWLWSWAFAIPISSSKKEMAKKFILWATSKDYIQIVGKQKGWILVPPGTRQSTYNHPQYQRVASQFADLVLAAIENAPSNFDKVPYSGHQFVQIPEFQDIGNHLGHLVAEVLAKKVGVEQALTQAQQITEQIMKKTRSP